MRLRFGADALRRASLVVTLVMAVGVAPLARSQGGGVDASGTPTATQALLSALTEAGEILASFIPWEEKSAEIDALLTQLETACSPEQCKIVLTKLRQINDQTFGKSVDAVFGALDGRVPAFAAPRVQITKETLDRFRASLSRGLAYTQPEELSYHLGATLELLRFVYETLDNRLQTAESRAELAGELGIIARQGRAMWRLYSVVKSHGNSDTYTPQETEAIVAAVNDLGFFYMKLAQSVSNARFMVDESLGDGLKGFQDAVEPMAAETVENLMREQFGADPHELFEDFDASKPLATGTIAQVYRVRGKGRYAGRTMILKVRRPGVGDLLRRSALSNQLLFRALKIGVPSVYASVLDIITSQIVGIEAGFKQELDFRNEAETLRRFRILFALTPSIKIPRTIDALCGESVLAMEEVKGMNLGLFTGKLDLGEIALSGEDTGDKAQALKIRKRLFSTVLDATLYQWLIVGETHADMHPGNLLAMLDSLGIIDFGATLSTRGLVTTPSRLLFHLIMGNAEAYAQAFAKLSDKVKLDIPEFTQRVQALMDEKKLTPLSLKEALKADWLDRLEPIGAVFTGSVKVAVTEMGLDISPRYVQFFIRTVLPVTSSLVTLGKGIPTKELTWLVVRKLTTFAPLGVTRYALTRPLEWTSRLWASLQRAWPTQNVVRSCQNLGDAI